MEFLFNSSLVVESAAPEVGAGFSGGVGGGLAAQSCTTLAIPWTIAHQAPLSMGFSRQEYWSGLLFPPPGDLPNPRIEPAFSMSPVLAGRFFTTWEVYQMVERTLKVNENKTFIVDPSQIMETHMGMLRIIQSTDANWGEGCGQGSLLVN